MCFRTHLDPLLRASFRGVKLIRIFKLHVSLWLNYSRDYSQSWTKRTWKFLRQEQNEAQLTSTI